MRLGRHVSGLLAGAVALLAGVWLLLAPWVLGYQAGGSGTWSLATRAAFWTGVGVVVVAGLTIAGYAATLREDLRRAGVLVGGRSGRHAGRGRVAARGGAPADQAPRAGLTAGPSARVAAPPVPAPRPVPPQASAPAPSGQAAGSGPASAAGTEGSSSGPPTEPVPAAAVAGRAPGPGAARADGGGAAAAQGADPEGAVDIERVLLPIATALLADLTRRRAGGGDGAGDE